MAGASGFSLVEALLASLLMALVSLAAIAIYSNFALGDAHGARQMARFTALSKLRARLADDVFHAVALPTGAPDAACPLRFTRRDDAATLAGGGSGVVPIAYCLRDGAVQRESGGQKHILARRVTALALAFYDGRDWHARWPPYAGAAALPKLLRFDLELADGSAFRNTLPIGLTWR